MKYSFAELCDFWYYLWWYFGIENYIIQPILIDASFFQIRTIINRGCVIKPSKL